MDRQVTEAVRQLAEAPAVSPEASDEHDVMLDQQPA